MINIKLATACGLVLLAFPINLIGQQAVQPDCALGPLQVDSAVQIALRHHPAIARSAAVVEVAEAHLREARSAYLPQLSVSGIAKVGLSGATGALGLTGFPASPFFRNIAGSLNWYQSIFDFGRTKHHVAAEKYNLQAEGFRQTAESERVTLLVRRAFVAALEAQQLEQLATKTVDERRLTFERAQAYYRSQLKSGLDVALAQANLAEVQGGLIKAQSDVQIALAALAAAMGVDSVSGYCLQTPQVEIVSLPPIEELTRSALQSRPELQASEAKLKALSEEVGHARANRLPDVRGFAAGGGGRFSGTPVKPQQQHGVGGVGALVPIFTGGRLKAEQQEAEAIFRRANAERDEFALQVRVEVARAYFAVADTIARAKAADEQSKAAQDARRLAEARYKLQLASFLDLTTSEVSLTRAEVTMEQARYDYQRALADLEFAAARRLVP